MRYLGIEGGVQTAIRRAPAHAPIRMAWSAQNERSKPYFSGTAALCMEEAFEASDEIFSPIAAVAVECKQGHTARWDK